MTHPDPDIAGALQGIGPRIQVLRERRGLTLADLSARTGISKSTLSRLETGQRRPSLELLLPLSRIYDVPLDDMVGAPEAGDPRVRLRPRRVNGRTVVPLTRHDGDAHAWKIVVPLTHDVPKLSTHEGMSWIYVLSGTLRLIVGEKEMTLEAGEVAEFDTRIPHWFGSDGTHESEILTIFGPESIPASTRSARSVTACVNAHGS